MSEICPVCHKKDKVIPIDYGLPGKKLMTKARRGRVILGGCVVSGCDPRRYCKRDKKNFKSDMKLIRFLQYTNAISFGIGTAILLVFLLSNMEDLVFIGLIYLLIAFSFNLGVLITAILYSIGQHKKAEIRYNAGLLLVNIPIAFVYFLVVISAFF